MTNLFRVRLVNVRPKANAPQLDTGEFSFSGDVLAQLPRYFEYIDLMRKVDLDAYEMFSRLGASLMPPDKAVMAHRPENVEPHYALDEVPAFGCIYLPVRDSDPNKVFADFIWWRKLDGSLPGVEASHGSTVFHVTALYHDKHRALLPMSYNIVAPSVREMRVLKEYTLSTHPMYDHKAQKDRRSYSIKRSEWQFPRVLKRMAKDNGRDIHEMGITVFLIAMTGVMSRKSGFQVRVAKSGRYAVFNVDESVSVKFFQDREAQVNENGRVKKIFHFVPGYQRTDGTSVRPHTKGLSEFEWNGYSVHIGKANFDYASPEAFRTAGVSDDASAVQTMTMAEMGVLMQRHIRTNAWTKARRRRKKR